MRLIVLLGTLAFHAFFGLTLMTGSGLLLADWYGAMGRTWGASAIVDQQVGGGIAWSVGEIPTAILALTVAYLWIRSDAKDAKRLDRKSDRSRRRGPRRLQRDARAAGHGAGRASARSVTRRRYCLQR